MQLTPCFAVIVTGVKDLADIHLLGSTLSIHDLREQAEAAAAAQRGRATVEARLRPVKP
jgi:hypothetical protein